MAAAENQLIARRLEEVAALLAEQGANPFRIEAYRGGAAALPRLREPASSLLAREGLAGLRALPGVGESLARSIREMILTGRLPVLDRLRGEADPVALLATVPGVGRVTAERLHHDLGLDSLEDLEAAAHDGRLSTIAGLGAKRIAGIVDSLASRLMRVRRTAAPGAAAATVEPDPPLEDLLDVDREYRERAAAGTLRRIAPRRFNPTGEAWLPVLHTHRGARHYTILYSNTARAHRLGKTRDWVVVYFDGSDGERQVTIITSERGPSRGRRIVRGREEEPPIPREH